MESFKYLIIWIATKVVNNSLLSISLILSVIVLRFIINRFFKDKVARWVMPVLWGLVGLKLMIPVDFGRCIGVTSSEEALFLIRKENNPLFMSIGTEQLHNFFSQSISKINSYSLVTMFEVVWSVGVVAMLIYCFVGYVWLKRGINEAVPTVWSNVRMCDKVKQPFIVGVFNPIVYMPSDVTDREFNYIVEHEHAHIERRDNIRKFVGYIILCIHWFNPLVWVAYFLLCKDIELACDERAVAHYDVSEKKTYANILLDWSAGTRAALAGPLAFGEIGVKERVKVVVANKDSKRKTQIVSAMICVFVALCTILHPDNAKAALWAQRTAGFFNHPTGCKEESEIFTQDELDAALKEAVAYCKDCRSIGFYPVNVFYGGDDCFEKKECCRIYGADEKDLMIFYSTYYNSWVGGTLVLDQGKYSQYVMRIILLRNEKNEWEVVDTSGLADVSA